MRAQHNVHFPSRVQSARECLPLAIAALPCIRNLDPVLDNQLIPCFPTVSHNNSIPLYRGPHSANKQSLHYFFVLSNSH